MRYTLERTTLVAAPLREVFDFFGDPKNLARITPASMGFVITDAPARKLREGDRIHYRLRVFGVPIRWTTLITSWRELESFSDLQERGPYRYWHHTHSFREVPEGVEMHDRVEYELPFGIFGRIFGLPIVRGQLKQIFDYRTKVIREVFTRPATPRA